VVTRRAARSTISFVSGPARMNVLTLFTGAWGTYRGRKSSACHASCGDTANVTFAANNLFFHPYRV